MHIDQAFPSNYIKASDLQGREVSVVIASAEVEKVGNDRKLVLHFQGKQKGMICNRTNANRIAHSYGNDTDGWVGKEIVLYSDMVDFQGRMVEAVRVKPPAKRASGIKHVVTDHGSFATSEFQQGEQRLSETSVPLEDTF